MADLHAEADRLHAEINALGGAFVCARGKVSPEARVKTLRLVLKIMRGDDLGDEKQDAGTDPAREDN